MNGIMSVNSGIVGVSVREYKNLRDVWLAWGQGLAIFGANGSGKTNLLECLALLLGTVESVSLARPRLHVPAAGALAVMVRALASDLPANPGNDVLWAEHPELAEVVQNVGDAQPALVRWAGDGRWWRSLGVTEGASFHEGISQAGLPDQLTALLIDQSATPVIMYGLEGIDLDTDVDTNVRRVPRRVRRRFSRTLMVEEVPESVAALADTLPDTFAPLRRALAEPDGRIGGWMPLMELPPTDHAPAELQWLPRPRTDSEIDEDVNQAFGIAFEPTVGLLNVMERRLPVATAPGALDCYWWLHGVGRQNAMAELNATAPGVAVVPVHPEGTRMTELEDLANFRIEVAGAGAVGRVGMGEGPVLDQLSAGQRRWADEALAAMALQYDSLVLRTSLWALVVGMLDEDALMDAALSAAKVFDTEVAKKGFWTSKAIDATLQALDPWQAALTLARRQPQVSPTGEHTREDVEAIEAHVRLAFLLHEARPRRIVRVFDEPEAHLHPAAQRAAAAALQTLNDQGADVVIASHSPVFLDLPGWTRVHVSAVNGRARVETIGSRAVTAQSALAKQLGVNRGELLAGISGLLFVEGDHDRLVLERLYGDELKAAGLAVIRMFGTDNLLAVAELDFLDRYVDVPVFVLVDNAKVQRVHTGRMETDEERKLLALSRNSRQRGRKHRAVGLDRPDITAYLNETAVRAVYPGFAGWRTVLDSFRKRKSRPKFKVWLKENFGVELGSKNAIDEVLRVMVRDGLPPAGDLGHKMKSVIADAMGASAARP
ncbi:AAA family ATPase [Catellatospora sp. NPDC049111]|uniref:ATP-dependent nuclease n=1 Tax=Catellatospora sp. NPDC049111 TaxID=3155271 RepID=UPI0033C1D13D